MTRFFPFSSFRVRMTEGEGFAMTVLWCYRRGASTLRVAVPTNKEERVSDVPMNESGQVSD